MHHSTSSELEPSSLYDIDNLWRIITKCNEIILKRVMETAKVIPSYLQPVFSKYMNILQCKTIYHRIREQYPLLYHQDKMRQVLLLGKEKLTIPAL
jgi:hypothetical protein